VFTGLIADLGRVEAVERDDAGATLSIRTQLAGELSPGDSIAVNGVCLTAVAAGGGVFRAEAMPETLTRSSLGALDSGDAVNLELAMRLGDRLGGHIVQGHVDGTGTIASIAPEGISRVLQIDVEPELARYLVEKGSIAVDGVSLTVSALREDGFAVSLIPETLERTTLGALEPGARVNVEVDVLAKHVERLIGMETRQPARA
jgi:riboflavin synthase